MSKWISQKPQVATEADCKGKWSGGKHGEYFRCALCGHRFQVGDYWRWVAGVETLNFKVCKDCDSDDVREKYKALRDEYKKLVVDGKYWSFVPEHH